MKTNKKVAYMIAMAVIITVFITFLATFVFFKVYYSNNPKALLVLTSDNKNGDKIESLVTELMGLKTFIDEYYDGDYKEEDLTETALYGYIMGLGDKYSQYIPAVSYQEYEDYIKGNYVGIGIYITLNQELGRAIIVSVIPNAPAEKAGLKEGDLIISVNGKEYNTDNYNDITENLKGGVGSPSEVVIERDGERQTYTITREEVKTNQTKTKIYEDNIGYMRITSFGSDTYKDFVKDYQSLVDQGATSLIIDLRENGGGILDEALDIADEFVDRNQVLLIEANEKKGTETSVKSKMNKEINMPVVVLVDNESASASEVLTGILKDYGVAKVVGKNTYGKGVVQTLYKLTNGSALKITTSHYYTPNRNQINEKGIAPDYEVDLPKGKNALTIDESEDAQLQKAIEILKNN